MGSSKRRTMQITGIVVLAVFIVSFTSGAPTENSQTKPICPRINLTPRNDLIITLSMISELGIHVLPDQRLCFFGRLLNDLVLPKNPLLQIPILKGLFTWYSPCLQVNEGYFQLNNDCFDERENQFFGTFMSSFSGITSKPMNSRKLLK